MPTTMLSILSRPCLIGLRLRPKRLFGFDGTAGGNQLPRARCPRGVGLPSATAPSIILMRRTVARRWRCLSATIIWMIWRRRATRSARCCVASSGSGRTSGFVVAKRAMMAASIGSVLARVPAAWARCGSGPDWRRRGQPGRAEAAATTVSKPRVASTATSSGGSGGSRSMRSSMPCRLADHKRFPPRRDVNVEPILRDVDPTRSSILPVLAQAGSLRPKRLFGFDGTTGGGSKLPLRARGPRGTRSPARHRAKHHAFSRQDESYKGDPAEGGGGGKGAHRRGGSKRA